MRGIDLSPLQDVEAGDQVVVRVGNKYGRRGVTKVISVERVTKAQIVISGDKFWKKNGRRVGDSGDSWGTNIYVYPLTPETEEWVEEYRKWQLHYHTLNKVKDINWRNCTIEQLNKVLEIVEQAGS